MATRAARAAPIKKKLLRIAWLRNELRVRDNYVLAAAARDGAAVLPVVIFEEREYPRLSKNVRHHTHLNTYGAQKKTGPFRAQFHRECVADLRQQLHSQCKGSQLFVAFGQPSTIISALCNALVGASAEVVCAASPCWEEQQDEAAVETACLTVSGSCRLIRVHEGTMYHPDDVLEATHQQMPVDLPSVFTNWRQRLEKNSTPVRRPIGPIDLGPLPSSEILQAATGAVGDGLSNRAGFQYLPTLQALVGTSVREETPEATTASKETFFDLRGEYFAPVGGESAALARLQQYMWDEDRLREYFKTRNGMVGQAYSTKLAPWLAKGCISPRFVHAECKRYERERKIADKNTYWVIFELMVRDYFIFYAGWAGRKLFHEYGVKGKPIGQPWRPFAAPSSRGGAKGTQHPECQKALEDLEAWKSGATGHPLVDANMRELAATGFMSNRGRQNVASYLVHDLNLDWRYGAAYFEEKLVDYTPEANWGNWHAVAALNGGRVNHFNVVKQGKQYDEGGVHARLWCPELANVPVAKIHEPWKMTRDEQRQAKCVIGEDYPAPLASQWRGGARRGNPPPKMRANKSAKKNMPDQEKQKAKRKKKKSRNRVQGAWSAVE